MTADNYEETRIRHKIYHHHVESISQDSVIRNILFYKHIIVSVNLDLNVIFIM